MNANDARIARLYTAADGGITEDASPNAGPPRSNQFDVIAQLEAGNVIGQSGGNYTLNFTVINENTGLPEAALVPTGNPFNEEFDGKDPNVAGTDWQASGRDFVRTGTGEPLGILRFNITVPAGLTGRFHINLEFVDAGFQVVNLAQSNVFILV
jgi:hypothetical protein